MRFSPASGRSIRAVAQTTIIKNKGISQMRISNLKAMAAAGALAVAAFGFAAPASAQTDVDLSANIGVTSDYVFRGFTQTLEDPAIQGGLDLTAGSFYAGVWASNVDFGDSTDAEIDAYIGVRGEAVGFAVDVGLIGYGYVNDPNGSGYAYGEAKVAVSRAVGPGTVGVAVYYSPDFFGVDEEATYYELNVAAAVASNITISAAVGEQKLDISDDYTTWNLGATWGFWGPLSLDARFITTDLDSPLADERFVGTLKAVF